MSEDQTPYDAVAENNHRMAAVENERAARERKNFRKVLKIKPYQQRCENLIGRFRWLVAEVEILLQEADDQRYLAETERDELRFDFDDLARELRALRASAARKAVHSGKAVDA